MSVVKKSSGIRGVPAIEIDTDLANAQYDNQNEIENMKMQIGDHLQQDSENQDEMIKIEGEDEFFEQNSEQSVD